MLLVTFCLWFVVALYMKRHLHLVAIMIEVTSRHKECTHFNLEENFSCLSSLLGKFEIRLLHVNITSTNRYSLSNHNRCRISKIVYYQQNLTQTET